jgi:hypothetical protein
MSDATDLTLGYWMRIGTERRHDASQFTDDVDIVVIEWNRATANLASGPGVYDVQQTL